MQFVIAAAVLVVAMLAAYADGWASGHRAGRFDALATVYGAHRDPQREPHARPASRWRRVSARYRLSLLAGVALALAFYLLGFPK